RPVVGRGGIPVKQLVTRLGLTVAVLFLALARAPAQGQPKKDEPFDYRRFFKKPTNTMESWEALKFELEVGRADLAAQHLRELLRRKPTADDLYKLQEKQSTAPFLRLRLGQRRSKDSEADCQARQQV